FGITPPPGFVDENLAHQSRRNAKEMSAALTAYLALVHQPHIGIVEQRRSLQQVAGFFAAHVLMGQPVQLVINQWHEFIQRRLIAVAPSFQQPGYFMRCVRHWPYPRKEAD